MQRLERVRRMLFAAGERPITARELAWQTGVRVSGVRHVLRLLELQGQAERLQSVTSARALVWRWKDRQGDGVHRIAPNAWTPSEDAQAHAPTGRERAASGGTSASAVALGT